MPDRNLPLKILHILDHSLPLHSGYAFRSESILQWQIKRGWQPVVLTSPKHEASSGEFLGPIEHIEGIKHYRTGPVQESRSQVLSAFRVIDLLTEKLHDVVKRENPSVIHAHSPVLNAIPAIRVARRRGLPVVYEIRAFWEDAGVDHRTFAERSWKYKVVRFVESWACRKADHVAVLCSGLKKDLIQRGISPDKLTIISNGVDPDQFGSANVDQEYQQTWQLDGRTTIGFIGSFYRYEGLDLLVKAFSRVARVNPDVILLFVGGGETENELRNLVAQLSVEKQVIFGGRIAHNRIPGVYALMDVMVYPRYSVRLTELVTPLKPLEAMAMGKMIIASDIEGHREMIQHGKTGILFPPSEPEALAQALLTVINNPGMRGSIGSCASEWVRQNRSWEKTTEPYGSIYSRVMKR